MGNQEEEDHTYSLRVRRVQHVPQRAVCRSQQRPDGAGPLLDVSVLPVLAAITQEGAEQTGVGVLHQFHLCTDTHTQIDMQAQV